MRVYHITHVCEIRLWSYVRDTCDMIDSYRLTNLEKIPPLLHISPTEYRIDLWSYVRDTCNMRDTSNNTVDPPDISVRDTCNMSLISYTYVSDVWDPYHMRDPYLYKSLISYTTISIDILSSWIYESLSYYTSLSYLTHMCLTYDITHMTSHM